MFKFVRRWDSNSVRTACVKFGWYNLGECSEYYKMLDFVDSHKPTDRNINRVIEDIFNHSDQEGRDLESVAYCFGLYAVRLISIEE